MEFSPIWHSSQSVLQCLQKCNGIKDSPLKTISELISNSFLFCPPPPPHPTYIPSVYLCCVVCGGGGGGRNTILCLYIIAEVLCVHFVKHGVGEILFYGNDHYYYYFSLWLLLLLQLLYLLRSCFRNDFYILLNEKNRKKTDLLV